MTRPVPSVHRCEIRNAWPTFTQKTREFFCEEAGVATFLARDGVPLNKKVETYLMGLMYQYHAAPEI